MEQNKEITEFDYASVDVEDYYQAPDGTYWISEQDYNLYVGYTQQPQVEATTEKTVENSLNLDMSHADDFFFLAPDNKLYDDEDLYIICAFKEIPHKFGDEAVVWMKGQYLITPDGKIFLDSISAQLHMKQFYTDIEYSMKEITMEEITELREFYVKTNMDIEDPFFQKLEQISGVLKGQQTTK